MKYLSVLGDRPCYAGSTVRLLFAISIASFCTVLWLSLALARRVRRDREARNEQSSPKRPLAPAREFFEAGEFRTPRALRTNQKVLQHIGQQLHDASAPDPAEKDLLLGPVNLSRDGLAPAPLAYIPRLNAPVEVRAKAVATGSEAVIIDSKLRFLPLQLPVLAEIAQPETASRNPPPRDISNERKPAQSARSGTFRRVDLSHYNKDLGDLTDPHKHAGRDAGIRPSLAKNA